MFSTARTNVPSRGSMTPVFCDRMGLVVFKESPGFILTSFCLAVSARSLASRRRLLNLTIGTCCVPSPSGCYTLDVSSRRFFIRPSLHPQSKSRTTFHAKLSSNPYRQNLCFFPYSWGASCRSGKILAARDVAGPATEVAPLTKITPVDVAVVSAL